MRNKLKLVALAFLCVFLAACSTSGDKAGPDTAMSHEAVVCTDNRPKACTRDYRPVCATLSQATNCESVPCAATRKWTYPNACSACGDAEVISYVPGKCEE